MSATVVITTKNRKEDLRKTLASCATQLADHEVIVIDDGSTDGTPDLVEGEFPEVTLIRSEKSKGYIVQRNYAATVAKTPFLVSLDDDAIFSSPEILAQVLDKFDHPLVGAVAIPLVDVRDGPEVKQRAPDPDQRYLCERFKGTAYAVRRDLFLKLGGFRESFVHQGEEGDFCLRMLEMGYWVRLGYGDPIHHFESPRRDFSRVDHYGRRNDILFAWFNVPLLILGPHLLAVILLGIRYGISSKRLGAMLRGLGAGIADIRTYFVQRDPVSLSTYLVSRRLKRSAAVAMNDFPGADDVVLKEPSDAGDKNSN